jgi:hypothetical protein
MSTIKLTVVDDDQMHELIINNRTDGLAPDIREAGDGIAMADTSIAIDINHSHCASCRRQTTTAQVCGLTAEEARKLIRWRTANADGVTPFEMGTILDKLAKELVSGEIECMSDYDRIILRVESGDA